MQRTINRGFYLHGRWRVVIVTISEVCWERKKQACVDIYE